MFAMFPHAAKTLPVDEGLFKGPRPNFCLCSGMDMVATLLSQNQRVVVLCQDHIVDRMSSELDSSGSTNHFVLGCRDAKGLEFEDVLILDYFSSIPAPDQQSWKLLFQRDVEQSATISQQYKSPQVEPQLKLLYTAITRCCSRLFFVETKKSAAGSAFYRWLEKNNLAERMPTSPRAAETFAMSKDEWRARGLNFILSVDTTALGDRRSEQMLERAFQCFQNAEDHRLLARIRLHMQVVGMIRRYSSSSMTEHSSSHVNTRDELAVANIILKCLQQKHQLTEVIYLCKCIAPLSCEPKLFERDVYKRIAKHV